MVRHGRGGALFGLAVALAAATVPASADASRASGCAAGISSDFNGDGHTDTIVADPDATAEGQLGAGRVTVLYGDSDGRIGEGTRGVVQQGLGSVGGVAEAGDHFGAALAVADTDCDGYTDVVVGVPNEDINGQADSGYVHVVKGAAGGLGTGAKSLILTQSDFGLPITAGDRFGYSVDVVEDVGQGGTPAPEAYALGIGVPGGDVGGADDAGYVAFRTAYNGGYGTTVIDQDSPGVPGGAEAGDRFGHAVTLNHLVRTGPGDNYIDAAIGAPFEDVGAVGDAGSVTILNDVFGDELAGATGWTQDSAGVPGGVEAGDRFGSVLDSVLVGSTARLAVGVPAEDVGTLGNAGLVQLFSAGPGAATITPGIALSQDTAGVSGAAEAGDAFGTALAFVPPGLGDPTTWLAVGEPGEDAPVSNQGTVQLFPVTDPDAELTYSQDTAGVPGTAEAGDRFGSSLSAVAGPTERIVIVGVPDDIGNAKGMADVRPFGGGTGRYWAPGVNGVPSGGASRFGAALSSSGV